MANAHGQVVDTTYLTVEHTSRRGYFHRDYLAHCAKYSHFIKYLRAQKHWQRPNILDVGCGKETPIAKILAARQNITERHYGWYVGVDYGSVNLKWLSPESTFQRQFHSNTDFALIADPLLPLRENEVFQLIVSIEVLEHVEAEHCFRMLRKMYELMAADGRAFLSTPVYDPKVGAAANHVNEMSFYGFQTLCELAGFEVQRVTGTFASQRDYKHWLSAEMQVAYNFLKDYYEAEMLSLIMGPCAEPQYARNCLWQLIKPPAQTLEVDWAYLAGPEHGSSERWAEDVAQIKAWCTRKPRVKQLRGG